jgi:CO/xanthine dehydrogenase Mo-binding subunit
VGDVKAGLSGAVKTVEAGYWTEYTYHAQMEPMNAVAQVSEDGKSADIWTGTQFGALASLIISGILKTTPDQVRIHQQFLGGGYGRRIWPDAAIQAAILSNTTKKPVKLILTREEDIAAARPRPMTHHLIKAGLDAKGNLVGWHHRLVSENVDESRLRHASRRRAARTTSARVTSIRRSTPSRTHSLNMCVRIAACACTPGAASGPATTSLPPKPSSTKWRRRPARIRWQCVSN